MKITMVGAGNVGATCVKCLSEMNVAEEIVMVDIMEGIPQGKALDIAQSLALKGIDTNIIGTNEYAPTQGSDIVIITAGVARKPNMTREDLLNINAKIISDIAEQAVKYSPNAIYIVVTNPLDVMTQLLFRKTGLPKNRVVGMAGVLDNARFHYFLSKEMKVSMKDVTTLVLGSHGDTMIPVISATHIEGTPISRLLSADKIQALVTRARNGGAEIVSLLKAGSAYYAPAESICLMVDAIVHNRVELLPCAAYCEGEFGIHDTFCGVPVRLSRKGIEQIVEIPLSEDELVGLRKSADVVKENCKLLGI